MKHTDWCPLQSSASEFCSTRSEKNSTLLRIGVPTHRDSVIFLQPSHTHPLFTNCPLLTVSASMQISMKSSVRYAKKDSEIKQLTFQNATPMILPLCSQNAQSFVPQKEAEDAFHAFFPLNLRFGL